MRKSLIILGILEDRDLEWLIENGSGRRLQVGDYLLRQGRTVEAMYFLLAGRLGVELETPEAKQLRNSSLVRWWGRSAFWTRGRHGECPGD